MHDPMVVAYEIRRPWPQIRRIHDARPRGIRGPFWRFGNVELYWPGLITIWHVEPAGADAFEICKHTTRWQWHVHHWRLQLHPWQKFKRWAFQRCQWCGGRSRRGDYVNVSMGWESQKADHWWQSTPGVFHHDCISIHQAHRTCACSLLEGGPWAHNGASGPWGTCSACGGFRAMRSRLDDEYDVRSFTTELLRTIPKGERNPATTKLVSLLWKEHRRTADREETQP